jgi:hypothetical protein
MRKTNPEIEAIVFIISTVAYITEVIFLIAIPRMTELSVCHEKAP